MLELPKLPCVRRAAQNIPFIYTYPLVDASLAAFPTLTCLLSIAAPAGSSAFVAVVEGLAHKLLLE